MGEHDFYGNELTNVHNIGCYEGTGEQMDEKADFFKDAVSFIGTLFATFICSKFSRVWHIPLINPVVSRNFFVFSLLWGLKYDLIRFAGTYFNVGFTWSRIKFSIFKLPIKILIFYNYVILELKNKWL